MAAELTRDGFYPSIEIAMDQGTMATWDVACRSWLRAPPLHITMASFAGYKPPSKKGPRPGGNRS
jgi:hypothetical protein